MAKTKRFMGGGMVPPNTYPFASQPVNDNSVGIGARQEPLGQVMNTREPVTMYRRGGKVKKFADGGKAAYAIPDARARAAMREVEDEKTRKKMGEQYERSLTTTAPAPAASTPTKPPAKKAAGGCVKRYADGGITEGPNVNIDDDTRARAMAAIRRRMAGEDDEAPAPAPAVKRSAPKIVSKPGPSGRPRDNVAPSGRGAAPGSFADDKAHMEKMMRPGRDAIENVYPEQLIGGPSGVGLKALAGLASKLANRGTGRAVALRGAEETPVTFLGKSGARNVTPKPRLEGSTPKRLEGPPKRLSTSARKAEENEFKGEGETPVTFLGKSGARNVTPKPRLEGSTPKRLEGPPKRLSTSARKAEENEFKGEGETFGLEGGYKKGGRAKAYASGGSVKGAGIAQRGVKKCKMV